MVAWRRQGQTQSVIHAYLNRTRDNTRLSLSRNAKIERGMVASASKMCPSLTSDCEVVETVVSGQNVAIGLEYDIRDSATVSHVVVQTKFFGCFGQPLFACLSKSSHRSALELSRGTRLLCSIPRLPLQPGIYAFTIWCTVGDNLEDYVADAGKLTVVEGDYFGTGKLPPREIGDFIVAHNWTVIPFGELPSDSTCESAWGHATRLDAVMSVPNSNV